MRKVHVPIRQAAEFYKKQIPNFNVKKFYIVYAVVFTAVFTLPPTAIISAVWWFFGNPPVLKIWVLFLVLFILFKEKTILVAVSENKTKNVNSFNNN